MSKKLRFIQRHYEGATHPFTSIMQKIIDREPPFDNDPNVMPESSDPPFLEDYLDAVQSVAVVGDSCLCLVQSVLMDYLRDRIKMAGGRLPTDARKRALLLRYRDYYRDRLEIDWSHGPIEFAKLEEIVLARNEIVHQSCVYSHFSFASDKFAAKYPRSSYIVRYAPASAHIFVGPDAIADACATVEQFCAFLEDQWKLRGVRGRGGGDAQILT
ncbi:MAG: hypothetical protein M9913_20745 [Bryobacteraceae bacterium]|nr:hypothetical protein [Solibacteraceae bacterium]MCO5353277.1 hypothetical protein [Bryobacteraceae bacterium]